ncbi:asparagine synthase (glutamine-hydrolyzing) [Arcobacter sp.]|uniref:asparagine synthase (glutamine-hydrolyzing) n=1 Tax=Arcobacter sp. TaxID=1872629 RepID=UPI003C74349F
MCGIVGIIDINNNIKKEDLLNFNSYLKHRGPDDYGIFIKNNVGLGHNRLSILDLSETGKQPMQYENCGLHISYNGEIYNYLEIKEELIKLGYKFHTESDTEVILVAYKHWGFESFHKFNGMWAFAIYDEKKDELIISRDRFGVKPLYYFFDKKYFLFASEKKAILLSNYIDKIDIDKDKFTSSLNDPFSFESSGNTEFTNLYNLQPGHYLVFKNNSIEEIVKWWDLLETIKTDIPKTFTKRKEKFLDLLKDSCKLRTRADVKRTTSLSGGLDSSSIVTLLSKIDNQKYETFSHSFPDTFLDEIEFAEKVAESSNIRLNVVKTNSLKDSIDNIIYHFESIYAGMPDAAYRIYKEQNKAGYKISIDGHGADELLGGYYHYLDLILEDTPLHKFFRLKMILDTKHNLVRSKDFNWRLFLRYFKNRLKSKSFLKKQINIEQENNMFPKKWKSFRKRLFTDFSKTMLPRILKNFEMVSMANSVEVRTPFLDHRLVSYIFSLPDEDLLQKGYTKFILRKSMDKLLDDSVNYRKDKIGFNSPIKELLSGELKDWVFNTLNYMDTTKSLTIELFQKDKLLFEFENEILRDKTDWSKCLIFWKKVAAIRLIKILEEKKVQND